MKESEIKFKVSLDDENIPEKIELNIGELHIGESIHAGAVELPKDVDLGIAEETVLAAVTHAMKDEDLETAVSEDEDITFDDDSGDGKGSEESEKSSTESE